MKLGLTNESIKRIAQSFASTVYRNTDDSVRMNVSRIYDDDGRFVSWDAYVFERNSSDAFSWVGEMAETYGRKRDLLEDLRNAYGPLKSIGNVETVTQGWDYSIQEGPEQVPDEVMVVKG